ncbi:MAG: hypothetical protein Q7J98_09495, partial [Kiritimatiellia bacterium]|nr:hypothetical protein [Kiritimatiellia bacterium]
TGNRRCLKMATASSIKLTVVILVCGLLIGLQGCSSTKNSSDIPWNVPQPWEGVPSIPGSE